MTHRRYEAWTKLRTLNDKPHIPWLCAGDFNEITRQEEKRRGVCHENSQMQAFQDVIDECGFMDSGFIGQISLGQSIITMVIRFGRD